MFQRTLLYPRYWWQHRDQVRRDSPLPPVALFAQPQGLDLLYPDLSPSYLTCDPIAPDLIVCSFSTRAIPSDYDCRPSKAAAIPPRPLPVLQNLAPTVAHRLLPVLQRTDTARPSDRTEPRPRIVLRNRAGRTLAHRCPQHTPKLSIQQEPHPWHPIPQKTGSRRRSASSLPTIEEILNGALVIPPIAYVEGKSSQYLTLPPHKSYTRQSVCHCLNCSKRIRSTAPPSHPPLAIAPA